MGVSVQESDSGLHCTAAKWIGWIDAKLRRVSNIVVICVYDTSVGLSIIEGWKLGSDNTELRSMTTTYVTLLSYVSSSQQRRRLTFAHSTQ